MKKLIGLLSCATLVAGFVESVGRAAPVVTRRGPDSLLYTVRNQVAPTEFGPKTITGFYQFQYTERGDIVRERMVLQIAGLETNATVSLTAGIGDDPANVVTAAHLPTDNKGRLRGTFLTVNPTPNRPSRLPPVPDLLLPLTEVSAICVEDSTGQLVANAGVWDAYRYQLVVKRNLTPVDSGGTAAGSMTLTANQRRAKLTLIAGGLEPLTDYTLLMNDNAVGVVATNEKGLLKIRTWPDEAPPVLQLNSLGLAGPNGAVLTTTLPR